MSLTASHILADAVLRAGYDVKMSEIKGMSQRGGSVTSDVRFGKAVFSPMVSPGEADYLVVLEPTQIEPHRYWLRPEGVARPTSRATSASMARRIARELVRDGLRPLRRIRRPPPLGTPPWSRPRGQRF